MSHLQQLKSLLSQVDSEIEHDYIVEALHEELAASHPNLTQVARNALILSDADLSQWEPKVLTLVAKNSEAMPCKLKVHRR